MYFAISWAVEWAPVVAWVALALNLILIGEKVWSWLPAGKRTRFQIEEKPREGRSGGADALRVPAFRMRWDKNRKACIIPGKGICEGLDRRGLQQAKRARLGFEMGEVTAAQDPERSFRITRRYQL